jgi:hypothetical protein
VSTVHFLINPNTGIETGQSLLVIFSFLKQKAEVEPSGREFRVDLQGFAQEDFCLLGPIELSFAMGCDGIGLWVARL